MKNIGTIKLAITYVGIFIGAGLISGQELWQFFACFGRAGLLGCLLILPVFFVIFNALLNLVRETGEESVGRLLILGHHPRLQMTVDIMQDLFLFGIIVIMVAGAAALGSEMLGIPSILVGAVFTVLLILVALLGLEGMVATFQILVPISTACAMVLCAIVLVRHDFRIAAEAAGSPSPLLPNWAAGAAPYASYNIFGTVGVIIPVGKFLSGKKLIRRGLSLGSILLLLLIGSIITALAAVPASGLAELPMMVLAETVHPLLAAFYGILMGLGMFSCALGSLVALLVQVSLHRREAGAKQGAATVFLAALAFVCSLLGFGNLVGIIYPIFGYASIPLSFCLLGNYHRLRKGTLGWNTEKHNPVK